MQSTQSNQRNLPVWPILGVVVVAAVIWELAGVVFVVPALAMFGVVAFLIGGRGRDVGLAAFAVSIIALAIFLLTLML